MIQIFREEYEALKNDSLLLQCLRNTGVDNWDGWDDAIDAYNDLKGE